MPRRASGCWATLVLVVAACGPAGGAPGPSVTAVPSATPAPTATSEPDFVLVRSAVSCDITGRTSRTDGDTELVVEHFVCDYVSTDPRLTGRAEGDVTTTFEPSEAAAARFEGTFTITNEGGSWSGPASGALAFFPGVSGPTNFGYGVYKGSGGYDGYAYHEIVKGSNARIEASGWIERTD